MESLRSCSWVSLESWSYLKQKSLLKSQIPAQLKAIIFPLVLDVVMRVTSMHSQWCWLLWKCGVCLLFNASKYFRISENFMFYINIIGNKIYVYWNFSYIWRVSSARKDFSGRTGRMRQGAGNEKFLWKTLEASVVVLCLLPIPDLGGLGQLWVSELPEDMRGKLACR